MTSPYWSDDQDGVVCFGWSSGDRAAVDHRVLDHVRVGATLDLEKAMVTPIFVPTVCDKPVRDAALSAEAHDLDCVAAEHWIVEEFARVDTGFVRDEALVHKEHAGDRS